MPLITSELQSAGSGFTDADGLLGLGIGLCPNAKTSFKKQNIEMNIIFKMLRKLEFTEL